MYREEFSERVVSTLHSVLKEHPKMLARVLDTLGFNESYLRSVKRPQHNAAVKVGTVGAALEVAGIEPGVFWMRAFPEETDALMRFVAEARVVASSFVQPKTLVTVTARFARGDLLDSAEDLHDEIIRAMNRERFVNLKRTAQRASALARSSRALPVVARALGVWATTLRMQDKHTKAHMVLGVALACADGYTAIQAELAIRASYIMSDRTRFQDALLLAEVALILHARNGNLPGIGKALVDSGRFQYHLGRNSEAISTLSASLSFLPDEETHYLATAHQYMGLAHVQRGELEQADACANRSATFVPPGREKLKLSWLRARIAEARGHYRDALSFLEPVLLHPEISALDRGLATAEVVHLKLRVGDVHEAIAMARTVAPVLMATNNEQVQAAVISLIDAARRGDLTITVAEQLIRAMQDVGDMGTCLPRPTAR